MKISLVIAGLFCLNFSFGQIKSGTFFLGPSIRFSSNTNSNEYATNFPSEYKSSSTGFDAYLRFGYFVKDNFVIGLMGGYGVSSSKSDQKGFDYSQNRKDNLNNFSIGAFTRMYKFVNQNKLGVFGQLNGTYQFGKGKSTDTYVSLTNPSTTNKGTSDQTIVSVGLQPGIVYFITEKIGIEMLFGNLSYASSTSQGYNDGVKTNKSKSSGLNLNLGLSSLYLGFNIYFGGKKA